MLLPRPLPRSISKSIYTFYKTLKGPKAIKKDEIIKSIRSLIRSDNQKKKKLKI